MVVSVALSASATDTPVIASGVSSLTICAPGTVLTGGSATAVIETTVVCTSLSASPSKTNHDKVRVGSSPESVGLSLVEENATACRNA